MRPDPLLSAQDQRVVYQARQGASYLATAWRADDGQIEARWYQAGQGASYLATGQASPWADRGRERYQARHGALYLATRGPRSGRQGARSIKPGRGLCTLRLLTRRPSGAIVSSQAGGFVPCDHYRCPHIESPPGGYQARQGALYLATRSPGSPGRSRSAVSSQAGGFVPCDPVGSTTEKSTSITYQARQAASCPATARLPGSESVQPGGRQGLYHVRVQRVRVVFGY